MIKVGRNQSRHSGGELKKKKIILGRRKIMNHGGKKKQIWVTIVGVIVSLTLIGMMTLKKGRVTMIILLR
jgi:hypothetical protein